jgi:hypothetical protein
LYFVVERHRFDADPDLKLHLDADPDPHVGNQNFFNLHSQP